MTYVKVPKMALLSITVRFCHFLKFTVPKLCQISLAGENDGHHNKHEIQKQILIVRVFYWRPFKNAKANPVLHIVS